MNKNPLDAMERFVALLDAPEPSFARLVERRARRRRRRQLAAGAGATTTLAGFVAAMVWVLPIGTDPSRDATSVASAREWEAAAASATTEPAAPATTEPAAPATTEPSFDLSAGNPGLVTGQLLDMGFTPTAAGQMWQEDVAVDGGFRQRVREAHATSEMSDERLSGSVTITDNADRFTVADEVIGDVLWGTVVIENDQGTWTGTLTGTSDLSTMSGEGGVSYIELVGAGAYEGLSAIIFEREAATAKDWNGVIFSGTLPPDR
jgi:hypothetical protein